MSTQILTYHKIKLVVVTVKIDVKITVSVLWGVNDVGIIGSALADLEWLGRVREKAVGYLPTRWRDSDILDVISNCVMTVGMTSQGM